MLTGNARRHRICFLKDESELTGTDVRNISAIREKHNAKRSRRTCKNESTNVMILRFGKRGWSLEDDGSTKHPAPSRNLQHYCMLKQGEHSAHSSASTVAAGNFCDSKGGFVSKTVVVFLPQDARLNRFEVVKRSGRSCIKRDRNDHNQYRY